jgi:hypothetical protein
MSRVKGDAIGELERLGPNIPFERKAELLVRGTRFSEKDFVKDLEPQLAINALMARDAAALHKAGEWVAEANTFSERFNNTTPIFNSFNNEQKNVLIEQFWYIPPPKDGGQDRWKIAYPGQPSYLDQMDPLLTRKVDLAAAVHSRGCVMLGLARAAKHPTWAAILFLTRRLTSDLSRANWGDLVRMFKTDLAAEDPYSLYRHFEILTDQETLSISAIRRRVEQLFGVDMGPKTRRAAEILGIPIKQGNR